jgi:hypothetical protein
MHYFQEGVDSWHFYPFVARLNEPESSCIEIEQLACLRISIRIAANKEQGLEPVGLRQTPDTRQSSS